MSESEGSPMLGAKAGKKEAPSVKTIGLGFLFGFLGFCFALLCFLKFTGALQNFINETTTRIGIIVLCVILFIVFIVLIAIHIDHVFKEFENRFNRLEGVITGKKELPKPVAEPEARLCMAVVVTLVSGVAAIGVELFILKLTGALNPFLDRLEMYAAIGLLAVALVVAVVGTIFAKGYLMFEFFQKRFEDLEKMCTGALSEVMGEAKDVEKAMGCKTSCSVQ